MEGSRPMRYTGPLTPETASAGIARARQNARTLLADSELLLANGRWPRAVALAILALEESGKASILRAVLLARTEDERKAEWRDFRQHTAKNFMSSFLAHASPGARLGGFRSLMTDELGHRDVDTLKQFALYTDCYEPGRWSIPDEALNEELASAFVTTARFAVGRNEGPMSSPEELRLWVRHLSPVWKTTMEAMKRALASCYREAAAKGILSGGGDTMQMMDFLGLD